MATGRRPLRRLPRRPALVRTGKRAAQGIRQREFARNPGPRVGGGARDEPDPPGHIRRRILERRGFAREPALAGRCERLSDVPLLRTVRFHPPGRGMDPTRHARAGPALRHASRSATACRRCCQGARLYRTQRQDPFHGRNGCIRPAHPHCRTRGLPPRRARCLRASWRGHVRLGLQQHISLLRPGNRRLAAGLARGNRFARNLDAAGPTGRSGPRTFRPTPAGRA